jgi:4'-phosphopantetheinyl transferase EntD
MVQAPSSRLTFWRDIHPGLGVAELTTRTAEQPLLGHESDAARTMTPARRAEFAAGRACARHALASIGGPFAPIGIGPQRAPVWPASFVGSITHSGGYAAAVAAREGDVAAVGIDVEALGALTHDLWETVLTEHELDRAARGGQDALFAAVAFSAKECIHKVVAPRTGVVLDFHDAELLRVGDGQWTARIAPTARVFPGWQVRGRFAVDSGLVLCGLVIPAGAYPAV